MSDAAWMIISQSISAIVLGVIGYVSLKYKASADNVSNLEATVAKLQASVKLLEAYYEECQKDRRELIEKNADQAKELANLKTEKLTREIVKESVAEALDKAPPIVSSPIVATDDAGKKSIPVTVVAQEVPVPVVDVSNKPKGK